jgi:hypothetical protein
MIKYRLFDTESCSFLRRKNASVFPISFDAIEFTFKFLAAWHIRKLPESFCGKSKNNTELQQIQKSNIKIVAVDTTLYIGFERLISLNS